MITSHKGEILPLKKQLIPISENTSFHASFNDKLYGMSKDQKVNPFGYQKSLYFDHTDDFVEIQNNDSFDIANSFTVEAWAYCDAPTGSPDRPVVSKGPTDPAVNNGNGSWELFWGWGDDFYFIVQGNSINTTGVTRNAWHHVVGVFDVATNFMGIYIDGNLVVSGGIMGPVGSNLANLWIGHSVRGGAYFGGYMNEVRLWNYARTATQIKENMNTQLDGTEKGLVGYWKLNEGSGEVAYDSANGNDGLLMYGPTWESGRIAATLRPFEGKFGGAVAIEEATTNIPTNQGIDLNSITYNAPTVAPTFYKLTSETVFDMNPLRVTMGSGGNRMLDVGSLTVGATYSFSIYVRPITGDRNMSLWTDEKTGPTVLCKANRWTRLLLENFAPAAVYRWLEFVGWQNDDIIDVVCPQLENKAFCTSFVNGTRVYPSLEYDPKSIINFTEGTISLWFRPTRGFFNPSEGDGWSRILGMSTGVNYNEIQVDRWSGTNKLTATVSNNSGQPPGGTWTGCTTTTDLTEEEWYHVVFTWSATTGELCLYLNGVMEGHQTGLLLSAFPTVYGNFVLGYHAQYGRVGNVMINDVRIDTVVLSADEILAMYQSDSPLYNHLDNSEVTY